MAMRSSSSPGRIEFAVQLDLGMSHLSICTVFRTLEAVRLSRAGGNHPFPNLR